jgi:hypothetical protein
VSAANTDACAPGNKEASQQQSATTIVGVSTVPNQTGKLSPSTAPSQQQKKQKSSRMSWLLLFSHHQKKYLKSSSVSVGKMKTKQCKTKVASSELPELEERTPEHHSPKASWMLGLGGGQAQWTTSASLHFIPEQHNRQFKISSPQLSAKEFCRPQITYTQQKCSTLSRSPSPAEIFVHQQPHFLPMVSSVGTERRNSMWALGSSKPSMSRFIFM